MEVRRLDDASVRSPCPVAFRRGRQPVRSLEFGFALHGARGEIEQVQLVLGEAELETVVDPLPPHIADVVAVHIGKSGRNTPPANAASPTPSANTPE